MRYFLTSKAILTACCGPELLISRLVSVAASNTYARACLHVRDFCNSQHSADKKSRQYIVVAHPFAQPDLDLQGQLVPLHAARLKIRIALAVYLDEVILGSRVLSLGPLRHVKQSKADGERACGRMK